MNQKIAAALPASRWGKLIPIAFITYSLAYLSAPIMALVPQRGWLRI